MSLCSLTEKLDVHAPIDKVFLYFTDTDQMVRSFPPSMKLALIRRTSRHITQGSTMEIQTRLLGFSIHWKSYVYSFSPKRHITCIWQRNPYTSLEQDYYFEAVGTNHTRITECLLYRMPLGKFGQILNSLFVKPYLKKIVEHRRKNFLEIFPEIQKQNQPNERLVS
jgi:ligand-binding SRPBCC domain-containing protein